MENKEHSIKTFNPDSLLFLNILSILHLCAFKGSEKQVWFRKSLNLKLLYLSCYRIVLFQHSIVSLNYKIRKDKRITCVRRCVKELEENSESGN